MKRRSSVLVASSAPPSQSLESHRAIKTASLLCPPATTWNPETTTGSPPVVLKVPRKLHNEDVLQPSGLHVSLGGLDGDFSWTCGGDEKRNLFPQGLRL
jgi:hypothetical protein